MIFGYKTTATMIDMTEVLCATKVPQTSSFITDIKTHPEILVSLDSKCVIYLELYRLKK